MRVYLAGGFYSDWRERIEQHLPELETFNPARDNDQSASFRFVRDDLAAIEKADLILAYYPGGYASHGMAAEMGYAAALRKPIYFIDETGVPDAFLMGLSKRFFANIDAFVRWWHERTRARRPLL